MTFGLDGTSHGESSWLTEQDLHLMGELVASTGTSVVTPDPPSVNGARPADNAPSEPGQLWAPGTRKGRRGRLARRGHDRVLLVPGLFVHGCTSVLLVTSAGLRSSLLRNCDRWMDKARDDRGV